MILLVWNSVATAVSAWNGFSAPAGKDAPVFAPNAEIPREGPGPLAPISARTGPFSFRQKYLLGKRIDINKASKEEISELPGISDKVAAAVVAERERSGGFRSPDDLLRVHGIKEKRLKKILPFLDKMPNN